MWWWSAAARQGSPPATTCAASAWTSPSSAPTRRRPGADPAPGGAWQHAWDSLRLFSSAAHSSLPGRLMPAQPGETYADAGHVVDYLADYEKRYDLPVQHGTRVDAVRRGGDRLLVEADSGTWRARAVISATGTWSRPFVPAVPGRGVFTGRQLHTVNYRRPADFAGQHVIVGHYPDTPETRHGMFLER